MTGMDFETAVARAHPDHVDPVQQLLDGDRAAGHADRRTEKYRSTDISGNYADFAKALGGYGERVTEPGEIVPAIKRGIEQTKEGKPVLLEFITAEGDQVLDLQVNVPFPSTLSPPGRGQGEGRAG